MADLRLVFVPCQKPGEAQGKGPGPESSLLKIKGSEIQQRITELALEAAGHYWAVHCPSHARQN